MIEAMQNADFDVIVVGAGMAGATAAAHLLEDCRVALLEAEDVPGYHSTGRSAALYILNYGPPDVRKLTRLSRAFFDFPPRGFCDHSLLHHRAVAFLARPGEADDLARMLETVSSVHPISIPELRAMVPALKPDYAIGAAIEEDDFDIDVAAVHQGFLRMVTTQGGVLALRSRAEQIERRDGVWHVTTANGDSFHAPRLVDAAGAWGDVVARMAGVLPLGLVPCRRTGVIIDPAPFAPEGWPHVQDIAKTWYAGTEARTRLMVSPCDQTPVPPSDVQPEEIDVALAIERMQQALAVPVKRIERKWAGLRTFTPDGSLAFGRDAHTEGFFWCVGQGGYGIQTSPAAGRLMADLVLEKDPGTAGEIIPAIDPARFASR